MYCVSINHKNADSKLRSQMTISQDKELLFFEKIKKSKNINGAVLLMTCNRNEVYFTGSDNGITEIEEILSDILHESITTIRKYFLRYNEESSIYHLYKVVCGMDSVIIGEVEIIRQIKDAYKKSIENNIVDGEINICFQGALSMARNVAENSLFTKLPESVGTLTTAAVVDFIKEKEKPVVMIIGASGSTGSIILNDLLDSMPKGKIICTTRKHKIKINEKHNTDRITIIEYDERYKYLAEADVVVSATSCPHYTFIKGEIDDKLINLKEHLFIDLAIPKDIDIDIKEFSGCEVKDIDYIKDLAKDNNEKKVIEAQKIDLIIREKVDELRKNLLFRKYMLCEPIIKDLIQNKETASLIYQLRDKLNYNTLLQVLDAIKEDGNGIFSIYDTVG